MVGEAAFQHDGLSKRIQSTHPNQDAPFGQQGPSGVFPQQEENVVLRDAVLGELKENLM